MNSTYELQSKKNQYYNLIDDLSSITKNLDGCIDNLQQVVNSFSDAFKIDSLSADENRIFNYHKELIERNNKIKNIIIPSIYEEIEKINAEVEQIESMAETEISNSVSYPNTSTTSSTPKTNSGGSANTLPPLKKGMTNGVMRTLY